MSNNLPRCVISQQIMHQMLRVGTNLVRIMQPYNNASRYTMLYIYVWHVSSCMHVILI